MLSPCDQSRRNCRSRSTDIMTGHPPATAPCEHSLQAARACVRCSTGNGWCLSVLVHVEPSARSSARPQRMLRSVSVRYFTIKGAACCHATPTSRAGRASPRHDSKVLRQPHTPVRADTDHRQSYHVDPKSMQQVETASGFSASPRSVPSPFPRTAPQSSSLPVFSLLCQAPARPQEPRRLRGQMPGASGLSLLTPRPRRLANAQVSRGERREAAPELNSLGD